jgi:hypothetical protein
VSDKPIPEPYAGIIPDASIVTTTVSAPIPKGGEAAILAAAKAELRLVVRRLIACQNRLYRQTGNYPDDLGAAIQRLEFLWHGIMAGLITPVEEANWHLLQKRATYQIKRENGRVVICREDGLTIFDSPEDGYVVFDKAGKTKAAQLKDLSDYQLFLALSSVVPLKL